MTNSSEIGLVDGVSFVLEPLVSDDLSLILDTINFTFISQTIVVFGIVTNIINIVVFLRQGLEDAVNITLLGLAVSDLLSLLFLIWMNISFSSFMKLADLDFIPREVQYVISGRPRSTISRVSGVITAFLTLQRCLSISMPLKAKTIFSPRRTKWVIIAIFVVVITLGFGPLYYNNRLGWKFNEQRNRSLLGLVFAHNRKEVEAIMLPINTAVIHFGAFFVIAICTTILVVKLKSKNKWRNQSNNEQSDKLSDKDRKVSKIVILLSVMFMVCFTPVSAVSIAMSFERELSVEGAYTNILHLCIGIGFIFEAINASMNILIYHSMSSRYRAEFKTLFGLKEEA